MNCTAFSWLFRALFCLALTTSTLTSSAQLGIPYGDATNLGGGCYRLTNNSSYQRGAVWYVGTVDVSVSWEMTADVYLGNNNSGADGMVFVLRDLGAPNLGEDGGRMGYGGDWNTPEIEPSVAVQMDTYQGGNHADPNYDHLAIFRDGEVDHNEPEALAGPVPALTTFGNIENGQEYQLRVTYNATTNLMTVYWDCVERLSETVDIEDILGTNTAKWGFTAATGGLNNQHRVCNAQWTEVEDIVAPDTTVCANQSVELTLSDYALNPVWSPALGLSSTEGNVVTATVSESQVYMVTYEDVCEDEFTLEVEVNVAALPATNLPLDTVACNGNAVELNSGPWPSGITGVWDDGSTSETFTANTPGTYTLTLEETASGCTATESVEVIGVTLPEINLGDDQTTCPYEPVSFDFSSLDPNLSFTWNGLPGTASYATVETGMLTLEWELSGCTASDEIQLSHHPTYAVTWDEDPVVLCLDEVETLAAVDAGWSGGTVSWLWNDGTTANALDVSQAGNYSVEITTPDCAYTYDLDVEFSPNQGVDLGADVLLCANETVTFASGYPASATTWISGGDASGTQAATTTVNAEADLVIAEISIGACVERDTVEVTHVPFFDGGLPDALDLCLNDSLSLEAAAGADDYTWNNGVDVPAQWVNSPGSYSVELALDGCVFTDEVTVSPSANTGISLGPDAVACDGEAVVLASGYTAAETEWWINGSPEGNSPSWTVLNEDAIVIAEVTVGACVERDTIAIDYAPVFNTGLPASLPLCNGDSTWLAANVGAPEYQWSNGDTGSGTWIDSPGTYTLVTPVQGCLYETSVAIQNVPLPVLDLGADQTICDGESLLLNTGLPTADATAWSTGTDAPTLEVSTAGTYSVTVTENGCSSTDAITVGVQALPVFDLGPDQMLCPDEEAYFYIYPLPEGATFSWNLAHYEPALTTNAPGTYTALVNWNGCLWTDEVMVDRAANLFVDIVEPLSFCEGESVVVSAENPDNLFPIGYSWSNGETTPAIRIERQGIYEVTLANACDTLSKSFEVTLDYCECPVYVPNAFTPDNDGANDLFKPVLGCEPDSYQLEIFNTWGDIIFATDNPETGWFGQVEDDPASTDYSGYFTRSNVYHWRITVEFPDEENPLSPARLEFQGHVHMIR
ncbi:MAG: lectin-like domain-containing protein [Flavobacteriales bacterium]